MFLQPFGFLLFLTCILAEGMRPPFDAPGADGELASGVYAELSGMRLGLFRLAELLRVPVVGALVTTLFLGGWALPWISTGTLVGFVLPWFGSGFANGLALLLHVGVFFAKVALVVWLQLAVRWTLPRIRSDRLMALCWKVILPLSLVNVFATGLVLVFLVPGGAR